jgi:hypothetical protein
MLMKGWYGGKVSDKIPRNLVHARVGEVIPPLNTIAD